MIEGLRVLPYWQQMLSETPQDARRDCGTCMKRHDVQIRKRMGCGHEPRLPGRIGMWAPMPIVEEWNAQDPALRDPDPVMHCPGYTTRLPEVQEVALCYPQYRARYLAEFLAETPSPEILYGCAVLERSHSECEAQRARERAEEGRHGR